MNKKLFIPAIMFVFGSVGMAYADNFNSITFSTTSGDTKIFDTKGLSMVVEGTNLSITNSMGESASLPLYNLVSMQFSNDTGITSLEADDETVKVYSVGGIFHGEYRTLDEARNSLPEGTYVLKASDKSIKIVVNR